MDLEERRSVQAEVDELLRSNQLDVVTAATGAKKALASRQWQRAKNAVAAGEEKGCTSKPCRLALSTHSNLRLQRAIVLASTETASWMQTGSTVR